MKTSQSKVSQSRPRTRSHSDPSSRLARTAIALAVCAVIDPAFAQVGANTLPTGPSLNAGQATVSTAGSSMSVNQTTSRVSLGWESFSIGSKASVVFSQPSASSVALNRVLGNSASQIFGRLSANGQVFLINPAGVVFAPGASVDVGGIVASTLNLTDSDFMSGRYVFSGDSQAAVVNQGTIVTSPGGYAALFGAGATNEGLIVAHAGTVAVAAGNRVVMDMVGDGLLSVSVDGAAVGALAANRGLIQADGGRVILSARAAGDLVGTVLNQTGVIEAKSASMRNGEIVLDGGSGAVNISGSMDVSGAAAGVGGGSIAVRGGDIVNAGALRANAGDNATAGSVNVVAGGNLTLEGTSRIEARGASVDSRGGNVYLYGGVDATALAGQVIDISGGTVSGDGGNAEFSAGNHGSFAGTILGNAAEGYRKGTFLIDPVTASVSGTYAANTTVQAEDNITIDGAVTINSAVTLTLLADQDDSSAVPGTWDMAGGDGSTVGVGTITRTGAFTITGNADSTSALVMYAGGSGVAGGYAIGTAIDPILTAMNGGKLTVVTNNPAQSGDGHASISNTGAVNLFGVNSGANLNNFTLASSGNITTGGGVTTGGNVVLTASVGSIVDGGGTIAAPAVSLTAANSIGPTTPILLATPSITLDAQDDVRATSSVAIANLSLTVNPGTGARTYSVVDTDAGAGLAAAAAGFNVTDSGADLLITKLAREGTSNINFSVTGQSGNISIADSAIAAGSGSVTLTATANSILDANPVASDVLANITTTGALTLIAQGAGASIGAAGDAGDLDVSGMTNVTLRTNNVASVRGGTTPTSISITADPTAGAVNYDVQLGGPTVVAISEDGANNLQVNSVTNAGTVLDFSLTAPAGNITLGDGAINLAAANSDVALTATAGAITDASTATSITVSDATGTLSLSAATGIGTAGAGNELNTNVRQISLTNGASGPINLSNTGSLTVTAFSNAGGGATTIETTGGGTNALTIAANIVQSGAISLSAGESTAMTDGDHLTVNNGITVQSTGGSVTLQAGDNVALNANSVVQANTTVSIAAGNGDNDAFDGAISMANPSTVTAGTSASLSAVSGITVSTVSAGTTASLTTTTGSILDDTNDTTLIDAPTGVTLSAVAGAVGADNTTGDIDTDTASLTASVGGALFVTNSNTTLSSLTLTLRPTGTATYFLASPGITTFTVADSAGNLNVTNVTAAGGNNLALSITDARATTSNVTVSTVATNSGAATINANNGSLTLTGPMTSGAATLSASGALILNGNITSSGASLTGATVTQATASTVNAGTGDILVNATSGAVLTDGDLTTSSNTATAMQILANTTITQEDDSQISATGVGGGVITLAAGGAIVQDGAITNAGNAATSVSITGTGITQNTGGTEVGTIDGGSGGVLIDANDGALTMKGSITTTSATATAVRIIDVTGPAVLGNIDATNGTVTLGGTTTDNIAGSVTQDGTTKIIASTLAGNVSGTTTLTNANQLGAIGSFTSGNAFTLIDNNDTASAHNSGLTVTGPLTTTNAAQHIDITANGTNAGAINLFVDNLTAHSAAASQAARTGNVTLTAANADVAGTANILESGGGDGGVDVTGNVLSFTAKNDIGAVAGAGPIEIQGNTLNMSAGGISSVSQTGAITLGAINSNGDFTFSAAGTITVGSPMAVNGDTLLTATGGGSNIIVQEDITRTSDAAGSFTLRAANHIMFRSGADFIAANATNTSPSATAVTLNSDRDATGGGAIYISEHSVLRSNGGSVTLGGGTDPTTTAAIGNNDTLLTKLMNNGIVLEGRIDAGAGNVILRGQSLASTAGVAGVIVRDTNASSAGDTVTVPGPSSMWIDGVEFTPASTPAFTGSGDITTTTGNVTIGGVGDKGAGNTQGVLITGVGTTLTTASGIVGITGGPVNPVSGDSNVGVLVSGGAVVSSTGTAGTAGAVTITGTGGAGTGDFDNGVVITSATTSGFDRTVVSVDGAALNLVGTGGGGAAADGSNVGVQILGGADVKSIGSGKVTLTGTGGATDGGGNLGIEITGQNLALDNSFNKSTLVRSTSTGATALRVDLAGVGGAGTGAGDGGILVDSNAQVRTATGNIALTGTGGAGASLGGNSNNFGIEIGGTGGAARVVTTSSGSIAFTGTGGATNDGTNYGIKLTSDGATGGIVESTQTAAGAGTITFTGTGGTGSGNTDAGILIDGLGSLVSSTVGTIGFTGTGGLDTTGAANSGIIVDNSAIVETKGSAQLTLDGTGADSSGGSNYGVLVDNSAQVRSTGATQTGTSGKVTVLGTGGNGSGNNDAGIRIATLGKVSTVDAEIEFQGFGGDGGATGGASSYGVQLAGGIVSTTGDGNVLITGVGGDALNGDNVGIYTLSSALIESTAANGVNPAGTITLSGTGGKSDSATLGDHGISITGTSTVSSKDGAIQTTGVGGALDTTTGGANNIGVLVYTGSEVKTTGLATISLTGTGGAGTDSNRGVVIEDAGKVTGTGTSSGSITITGTGTGTGNANYGVNLGTLGAFGSSIVSSAGTGAIGITGTSSANGVNNNVGVAISVGTGTAGAQVTTAQTGNITITGTGRGTGTGNSGVDIGDDVLIQTSQASAGGGTITITGTGGAGSTNSNSGIRILDDNGTGTRARILSANGAVALTGNRSTVSGSGNHALNVDGAVTIESTGSGSVTLLGQNAGGVPYTAGSTNNNGVVVNSGAIVRTTSTGAIGITGTGSSGAAGTDSYGVLFGNNALVTSTQTAAGGGTITVNGIGAAGTNSNVGVYLIDNDGGANASGTAAVIDSGSGAISITGTRGSGSGSSNVGVYLASNALIDTATGGITIVGQGAATGTSDNNGIVIDQGSTVRTTGTGAIAITGTGAGATVNNTGVTMWNNSTVISTQTVPGGGTITISGTGGAGTNTNEGVRMGDADGGGNVVGAAAAIVSGSGAIFVTGTRGGATGTGNDGVNLVSNALIDTQNGGITVLGQGTAAAATSGNRGVSIDLASTVRTTGTGAVVITGTGAGTTTNNVGVQFGNDSRAVSSIGTGTITVTGTGSAGTDSNDGVRIADANGAGTQAGITSTGGAIAVTGNRQGTGSNNDGIDIQGTTLIEATGAGGITLIGQNAAAVPYTTGQSLNRGIYMDGGIVRTTATGAIAMTGTGSGALGVGSSQNQGITINNATIDSQQLAAGGGSVTITGTGATSAGDSDNGVQFVASSVLSKSGNITIDGTRQGSGNDRGVIIQNGTVIGSTTVGDATGAISITGTDGGDYAVFGNTGTTVSTIGGATWAGPITITGAGTNSGVFLDGINVTSKGALANVTITSPDAVQLGGSTGGGNLDAGASTVTITTNTDGTAVSTEGFTQASGGITTTNATAGAVSITANTAGGGTGDILFRGITTGAAGTITLNSNAGDITEQSNGLGLLTATGGNVALSAIGTGSIGFVTANNNPVRTVTANITATTVDGAISLLESDGATFTTVTTGNNNRIDLQSLTGNITLGTIGTAVTNAGDVNILARSGSILNDASTATRITGGTVTLNASNAIGASGNFLDTTATAIAAKSGAGGTFISEFDGVDLTQTTVSFAASDALLGSIVPGNILTNHSTNGDYQLTAAGTVTTSAASGIALNGNTTITATGAASDIVISSNITQSSGTAKTLDLQADNSVIFDSGADLTSGGAGALAVTLNSDRDASGAGAIFLDANTIISTAANGGAIVLGGGTDPANVAAYGTATNVEGVRLNNAQLLSGAGAITITGQGFAAAGDGRHGVSIDSGSVVQSSTGLITVDGTGGAGTNLNIGVNVEGAGSRITSTGAGGNILVTGTGGAGAGNSNVGVAVRTGGAKIEATGSGTVTVAGTRGDGVNNNESIFIDGTVSSNTGALQVTGNAGGTVTGAGNTGVYISGGTVFSTASTVGITGTGGAGTGSNVGVRIANSGEVTAAATAITITGTGAGAGGGNAGVQVDSSGLVTTATGSITLDGTGAGFTATDYGVSLAGNGKVESTGTGSIALIGDGLGFAADISTSGGGNTIGNLAMTGEILLRSLGSIGMVSDATILNDFSAGTVVTLNAEGGGGFNQTAGSVTSDGLRFLGSGTFTLGQANEVNLIAGDLGAGSVLTLNNLGGVEIASLTSYQDGVGINQTTSDGLNVDGDVNLTTTGNITQSSPAVISGTTTLDVGGNDIVLTNVNNDFGTVSVVSAQNVELTDGTAGANNLDLGDITVTGTLMVNAGNVTDSGTITVPGETTFDVSGNMLLDSPNSDFSSVTFDTVGGDATLTDVNALVVNESTVGGALTLFTGGPLTSSGLVTVGSADFTVTSGGIGELLAPFTLLTNNFITLTITGTVAGSPAAGFVTNAGSGLLNLLPPTGLVQFQIVEFQPPPPATAASFTSMNLSELPQDEISDLLFVTDDPEEILANASGGHVGLLPNGADVNRGGGVRMPDGLPSDPDSGRGTVGAEDEEERRRRTGK